MTAQRLIKHNPVFLTEEELAKTFVVREAELKLLVDIIRENTGPANQHVIIVGPRGMGKTILVRRLALAVRQDDRLKDLWYPVVLPEELYDVAGEGELWLGVLGRIAQQERDTGHDEYRCRQRHEALRNEKNAQNLRAHTLTALAEFSDENKARLLIVIENLQMLLGEQSSSDDAWDIRHTLLNNQEIMLVITATTHFEEIMNAEKANFELFREIKLLPLTSEECCNLWHSVTGEELSAERIRPMEILTGGSPRLLSILANFATGQSLAELMDDLVVMIDDHTPYFKANVEALPSKERRVFVALAELWEPSEARQVAERCRLDVNTTSSLLNRLVNKGAVMETGKVGRKNMYQIAERLYNIYHLMRLSGIEAGRVKALVRFMLPFYGEERLAGALAGEACLYQDKRRSDCIDGYADTPALQEPVARALNGRAWEVYMPGDHARLDKAIQDAEKAISIKPDNFYRHTLASLLGMAGRWPEAFAQAKQFVDDELLLNKCPEDIMNFFIDAAAAGQAEAALQTIKDTKSEAAMEPLIVALKMCAGVTYRAPQEVVEVAKDVFARIEKRKNKETITTPFKNV